MKNVGFWCQLVQLPWWLSRLYFVPPLPLPPSSPHHHFLLSTITDISHYRYQWNFTHISTKGPFLIVFMSWIEKKKNNSFFTNQTSITKMTILGLVEHIKNYLKLNLVAEITKLTDVNQLTSLLNNAEIHFWKYRIYYQYILGMQFFTTKSWSSREQLCL